MANPPSVPIRPMRARKRPRPPPGALSELPGSVLSSPERAALHRPQRASAKTYIHLCQNGHGSPSSSLSRSVPPRSLVSQLPGPRSWREGGQRQKEGGGCYCSPGACPAPSTPRARPLIQHPPRGPCRGGSQSIAMYCTFKPDFARIPPDRPPMASRPIITHNLVNLACVRPSRPPRSWRPCPCGRRNMQEGKSDGSPTHHTHPLSPRRS